MDLVAAVGGREWLFSLADADSQVVVDFSHPDVVMDHIRFCLDQNIHVIAGTSGFTEERLETLRQWLAAKPDLGVMVVPNFAIGAVLTARFAREAARFFESVEIIELHHAGKVDAPSGTAVATARALGAGAQRRRARSGAGRHHAGDRRCARRRRRRHPGAFGPAARSGRPPGGHPGQRRGDAHHPARFAAPVVVHARGAGRHQGGLGRPGLTIGLEQLLGLD